MGHSSEYTSKAFKEVIHPPKICCHHLPTLNLLQTCLSYVLLLSIKEVILKNKATAIDLHGTWGCQWLLLSISLQNIFFCGVQQKHT